MLYNLLLLFFLTVYSLEFITSGKLFSFFSRLIPVNLNQYKRWERRYKGMESLNLNKLFNRFLDWKITSMLQCGSDLFTDLSKCFLKFKENLPKNGRTTNNSLLGAVNTICLGTYNLSKNFSIFYFPKIVWANKFLIITWFNLLQTSFFWHFLQLMKIEKFKSIHRSGRSYQQLI